jgi:hypothetical protein
MADYPMTETTPLADHVVQRRRNVRMPCRFTVRYRGLLQTSWKWQVSSLKDLGPYGVRFIADRIFQDGETLELLLQLANQSEPVALDGKVVWQRDAFSGLMRMNEVGVTFVSPEPPVQQAIDTAVKRLLTHH